MDSVTISCLFLSLTLFKFSMKFLENVFIIRSSLDNRDSFD